MTKTQRGKARVSLAMDNRTPCEMSIARAQSDSIPTSFYSINYFNTYILALVFTYFIVGPSQALIRTYTCIFHSLVLLA